MLNTTRNLWAMYTELMNHLATALPRNTNIPEAYANGSDDEQAFVQNLAIFFTQFFKAHVKLLETTPELQSRLLNGLEYLLNISYVDEPEVFKVVFGLLARVGVRLVPIWRFWKWIAWKDGFANAVDFTFGTSAGGSQQNGSSSGSQRRALYSTPMSKLRMLMISRMAKPEEVLIVEDENGNIVRETLKDNDVLVQYKIMPIVDLLGALGPQRYRTTNVGEVEQSIERPRIYVEHIEHVMLGHWKYFWIYARRPRKQIFGHGDP